MATSNDAERHEVSYDALETVLDGIDSLLCVCDAENFDIIYLNQTIKDYFSLKSDGVGQKCYSFLQGRTAPCEKCPYDELKRTNGKPRKWEHIESIRGSVLIKTARYITWPDGRIGHLESALDITDIRKKSQSELEYQNALLSTIAKISTRMLESSAQTFNGDLRYSLELLAGALDIDRVYIWRNTIVDEDLCCVRTYGWSRDISEHRGKALIKQASYSLDLPQWQDILQKGECINQLVQDMPLHERAYLSEQGIIAVLVVPVFRDDEFWGFIGFDNCHSTKIFSEKEELILRSAGDVIANSLFRHIMEMDIRDLKKEVDKIYYDPLTEVYSRRFFEENIEILINTLSRAIGFLSILMIDIDFFKLFNDQYGHIRGDDCLRTVAGALRKCVHRKDDFVARYGGEEFIAILPNTDVVGAKIIANRMLESVRNCNIPHCKSKVAPYVTVSIGVVTGCVKHTQMRDDYVGRADELLYESKQNGRDRLTCDTI